MSLRPRAASSRTYETVRNRDARWVVLREWKDRILGANGTWFSPASFPRAAHIKAGDERSIWRVPLDEAGGVYVKVFEQDGWAEGRLRRTLGLTSAQREAKGLIAASACGLAVPQLIAYGTRRGISGDVLIIKEVANSRRLDEAWRSALAESQARRTSSAANRLLTMVAETFARSHQMGFRHRDPHPANILVCLDPGGDALYFVDLLGAARKSRPIKLAAAARDLAKLSQWAKRYTTQAQRMRFVRRYLRRRVHVPPGYVGRPGEWLLARQIFEEGIRHAAKLARKRDRRIRRNGKYFTSIRLGEGWNAHVTLILPRRDVFPEADVPDRTAQQWTAMLKACLTSEIQEKAADSVGGATDFILVTSEPRSLFRRIGWTILGSPHQRYFELMHRLRHRDLPAPLVLGWAVKRGRWGLVERAALILPPTSPLARTPSLSVG